MLKNYGEKRGYLFISATTLLCCNKIWKKLICNNIFETGSYFGPQLVKEHVVVNNLNQIETSRFEMKSQSEPVMPVIEIDLGQSKVKG